MSYLRFISQILVNEDKVNIRYFRLSPIVYRKVPSLTSYMGSFPPFTLLIEDRSEYLFGCFPQRLNVDPGLVLKEWVYLCFC